MFLWLWTGFVSSYDAYLLVFWRDQLRDHEQNPVARMILAADGWDVSRLTGMKMFGTIFSLGALAYLYNTDRRIAFKAVIVLSLLQTWLLFYLLY